MAEIPRKRCSKCGAIYEGDGVETLYSCDHCGNGYLSKVEMVKDTESLDGRQPRGGGYDTTVTHSRDNF